MCLFVSVTFPLLYLTCPQLSSFYFQIIVVNIFKGLNVKLQDMTQSFNEHRAEIKEKKKGMNEKYPDNWSNVQHQQMHLRDGTKRNSHKEILLICCKTITHFCEQSILTQSTAICAGSSWYFCGCRLTVHRGYRSAA